MSETLDIAMADGVPERPAETEYVFAFAKLAAYFELTKPRIAVMVLVVTALGFYMALPAGGASWSYILLFDTLLGTAFVGAGANALNHYAEAEHDKKMSRTANRPLPRGILSADEVLIFAVAISVFGATYLTLFVNPLAAGLAALSNLTYVFLYTPLKRVTPLSVFVGAFPGALPPAIGWAAAAGSISLGGVLLFAILFFWQLPHFAAIAWMYRDDYARAGYPMMPVVDPEGTRTCLHMLTHTATLLLVSVLPVVYGFSGFMYAVGAVAMGLAFFAVGCVFVVRRTREAARTHLLASVIYLPCLFLLMVIDRMVVA